MRSACFVMVFVLSRLAFAETEALNWDVGTGTGITCLYGEMVVLATIRDMYYCGTQFDLGYTGVQHLDFSDDDHDLHTTLFSLWDTSSTQLARITGIGPSAVRPERFGGEGTGVHVNVDNSWSKGVIYRFFLRRAPGKRTNATDTSLYVQTGDGWQLVATFNADDGDDHSLSTFHGLVSWIENIGAPVEVPKIVMYDLWAGSTIDGMRRLTRCNGVSGSGHWGQLQGRYFLAEGSDDRLTCAFAQLAPDYGAPTYGTDEAQLPPLPDTPIDSQVVADLNAVIRVDYVDTAPPDTPAVPTVSGNDIAAPTLSGIAEPGTMMRIYDNGAQITSITADGYGNWSIAVPTLAPGSHSLTVTDTDFAGNTSDASPAVQIIVPAGGASASSASSPGGSTLGRSCGIGVGIAALLLAALAAGLRQPGFCQLVGKRFER